jgi:uncharacterized damage-inducible protein DinB
MPEMNPYSGHLGDQVAQEVISETAGRLRALLTRLGEARASRSPRPGKWSVREILCHLADTELVFAFRLRQALAQEHHVIQPFDQDLWARTYAAYTADEALAVFSAVRSWNGRLIRVVPSRDYSKALTHPERGTMTFQVLVETMAGHDLNHLAQIEAQAMI